MRATDTIAILTIFAAAAVAGPAAASPPAIEIPQRIIDFGSVGQGEALKAEFAIVNRGGEDLVIQVRPTCGCTVVDFDATIAPGATGKVSAVLDTKEFNGKISKPILVTSNAPEQPSLRLVVSAIVEPLLEILPRPLVRLNAVRGSEASVKVVIAGVKPDTDFKITRIEPKKPYVTAKARRLEAGERLANRPGAQYEVTLTLGKDAPLGFVSMPVVVHTDHVKAKAVTVKLVGTVRSAT